MKFLRIASCFALVLILSEFSAADAQFDFKPLAEGIYAAIARPTFRTNCNSVIVLLDDSVLVVDTESKPSAAREVIRFIKGLTNKPVKYIVITHFHADHTQGAEAYVKEWPAVEIISSPATRTAIVEKGRARLTHERAGIPAQMQQLREQLGQVPEAAEKERIQRTLREAELYLEETGHMNIALPTMVVADNLIIKRPSRTVEIRFLGKAHTDGDVWVLLPKDKILIAGDALQSLTPTMRDSYPSDWIDTLAAVEKLDFDLAIGGHGDVMRGKQTSKLWRDYFADLLQQSGAAYAAGKSLPDARTEVVAALLARYRAKFPRRLPETIISNVEKAYRVAGGATD